MTCFGTIEKRERARVRQRCRIGNPAPQPGWHARLFDRCEPSRHARLPQVFLGEDVAGDLAPLGRHLDSLGGEHDRSVGVADLAGGAAESDGLIGITAGRGKTTRDMHGLRFPRFLWRGVEPRIQWFEPC